jgi:glyoxylase-like metal-dependent hydrolase (beta-lactamase superfamily II)
VGSALAEVRNKPVIVDPIVAEDGWAWLDERVAGRPVTVLTTIRFHGRDRAAVLERYDADETVPDGVQAFPLADEETVFYFPEHRTLVVGDSIVGEGAAGAEGLRRCPASWVEGRATDAQQREAMQPLLDLDVERVLLSHGESVFSGAGPALARAITAPAED